jgi:hypothetical protein
MKKLIVLFAAIVLVSGLNSTVKAQSTAYAPTSATIITPISIVKGVNMNFGNIAVSATLAGTVVLAPDNSRTTGGALGVTLPNVKGTVSAAQFTVTGATGSTYSIALPTAPLTITDPVSTKTMTVSAFTSDPTPTGTLTTGTQTINVGATLNVAAAQTAGAYTNATGFAVTVNYN